MHSIDFYRDELVRYMTATIDPEEPKNLYAPVTYIMGLGGKRLRPVLTLMATEIFGADYREALPAALAVEVFHNFSLVHDDIMDGAPLRRGKKTVHEKWDVNTGILSGDVMLIQAYQLFENYHGETFRELAKLFSSTAIQVCEGQQYDVDFETRDDVTLPEYLKMIEYKTAVLVAAALKMGGIVAGASAEAQQGIYDFGCNLGLAFQLQDDYLDAFGDAATFGKQIGGDIIENKKTYLYLKALEMGDAQQAKALRDLFSIQPQDASEKIAAVKELFLDTRSAKATQEAIAAYTEKAFQVLGTLDIAEEKREVLRQFGEQLMRRKV
ncbi:polyprenyl synthetase family protein [Maribacter sp. 2307ULW6-5]|uniref:polyprenyl synthetase family protein n=1 Tax=Maribacter sp. 2307ULW6-5 TaxID=3386275 RepID=UPI0039BC689E